VSVDGSVPRTRSWSTEFVKLFKLWRVVETDEGRKDESLLPDGPTTTF
jgi:hypothetical protein